MKFKNDEDKLNYLRSEQYQERVNRILNDKEYAAAPDDDPTNPWKSGAQYFEGQISNEDAIGLQLVSLSNGSVFNEQNPPSQQQKLLVQNFLERSIGNSELNKFLNQDSVKQTDYYSSLTKSTAVNQLAYFSYKTRNIKEMGSALEKLDSLHNAIHEGSDVREQDKITLKEFAAVSELSKTLPFLESLNKSGFIEGNDKLTAMYNQAKKANDIVSSMEEQMTSDLKKAGPGVVIVDSTTKKSKILGKMLGLFEKIAKLFSKHGHASMLHFSKDGQAQRSHINPQLVQDKFDITKQLYGDMHKVDPVKLILEDRHAMLEQVYGKEWKQVVATKFKNIESELHNDARTKFGPIGASSEKQQYLAGLANVVPFGHKKLSATDYKDMHEKIMSGEFAKQRDTNMLCSEFVATTIAVSVVELQLIASFNLYHAAELKPCL